MSTSQRSVPPETASDICDALIEVSGAKATDTIVIVGRIHIDLLVELCRRGFARATCQAAERALLAGERADVLFAPSVSNDVELRALLAVPSRNLRPGGTMVVRDSGRPLNGRQTSRLRGLLVEKGFGLIKKIELPNFGGAFLCAGKVAAAPALAAA